jgi:ABC-type transporter MlaC component
MGIEGGCAMSSKIVVTLLASVAVAVAGFAADASAAGRPSGGRPSGGAAHGGGGFHPGGGAHVGGGGFHPGGGVHVGGVRAASGVRGFAGHSAVNHSSISHTPAVHNFSARGNPGHVTGRGPAAANALAAHNALNRSNAANTRNLAAAANSHGLYNRAGFNRNAFGSGHGWHRWGGRFNGGWGGWAGPVFWPYLYGDVFSYAFWPDGYYDPFWTFGSDFILSSIFAPGPYFGPDYYGYADPSNVYYGSSTASRQAMARTNAAAAQSCGGLAPDVTDLPIAQIRKTVQPTGDQAADFDALSAGAAKANTIVASSCPSDIPLTPVARLDAAEHRLDATIEAVQIVRGPLGKFYDSLSDEQRQKFDAMGKAQAERNSAAPEDLAGPCGQQPGDITALPVQRIEQVVQPNAQQQSAFDALKKASDDTAKELQASCPAQMPQTPVARLDAIKTRLTAMVQAMNSVRPTLVAFYDSLSDEQKAKFNTMGPPQNAAAAPQGQSSEQ